MSAPLRQVTMTSEQQLWRKVLVADLFFYNVAIFFFALLPPSTLIVPERLAMSLSGFAAIGLLAHAFNWFRVPGERWAYMVTGSVGTYVLLAYLHQAPAPFHVKFPFVLFLFSGIVSAYAAHIIDGGRRV